METRGTVAAPGSGEPPPMVAHGLTHTGKRQQNEDRYLIREDLALVIVADGFGGAAGGDIAARIAVDEIGSCFGVEEEQTLPSFAAGDLADGLSVATARFAIEHAHRCIRREAQRTGSRGMSAAVALLLVAGPHVVIGHVGSVRVYRLRADALEQLTDDSPDNAPMPWRVGAAREQAEPKIRIDPWESGDLYLVCTAGLHRVLAREPIRCTLVTGAGAGREYAALSRLPRYADPTSEVSMRALRGCAPALVGRAVHSGAADNLTAVVARPMVRGVATSTHAERSEA